MADVIDYRTIRAIKVMPRGFSNEWTTLYVPAERYDEALVFLDRAQGRNSSLRWREFDAKERAALLWRVGYNHLPLEVAFSLATIEGTHPVPRPLWG